MSDNITNHRVFNDVDQIIHFITQEDTYTYLVIDENQHDSEINSPPMECKAKLENFIPLMRINMIHRSIILQWKVRLSSKMSFQNL